MDKHWERICKARGGAPGYLERPPEEVNGIEVVKDAKKKGEENIYEDINGVRFQASDVLQHLPHLQKRSAIKRINQCDTWEEVVYG